MLLICLFFGISIESMMQSTIARCNWENKTQHSFLSLFVISKEIFIQLFNILVIRNYKYNGRSSHFGKQQMIYIHYLSTKYESWKDTRPTPKVYADSDGYFVFFVHYLIDDSRNNSVLMIITIIIVYLNIVIPPNIETSKITLWLGTWLMRDYFDYYCGNNWHYSYSFISLCLTLTISLSLRLDYSLCFWLWSKQISF